ncbi:MAG: MFS transporter [Cyanobacteria bacterium P01_F01_bin.33]
MAISSSLGLKTKIAYGMGELGTVIPVSISVFFLLFFLTDVAGLGPTLAGAVLLLGRVWDAINDPLIGWLSDRTLSPWGRRYPWMIYGAIPLALCCVLQWVVPPLDSQVRLFAYYAILSMVIYAAYSAVQLPFSALAAELAQDYDERTQLMGFKSGFNIGGSILGLVLAQGVFSLVADVHQQYVVVGWLSGLGVLLGISVCVWGTRHHHRAVRVNGVVRQSFWKQVPSLVENSAFRWVMGLHLCSWIGIQITASMLPYFVTYWMKLPEQHFTQMALAVQGTAVLAMPVWMWVARQQGKRAAYFWSAPFVMIGLMGLSCLQSGQLELMYGLGAAIGFGLASFYLVPLAMLPDIIELDTARTQQQREGLFFSFLVFFQKLALAIALFIVGQLLDLTGFSASDRLPVQQPDSALWAIRLMMGALPALLIGGGLYCAYQYPITRTHLQTIHSDEPGL